ncbi:MAG: hypothetical protein K2Y14_03900 [Burkholderiales bacterium]|nr:hypothetical protein [Burkholderiales bacterium]
MMEALMSVGWIKLGWVSSRQFNKLTGLSSDAVAKRIENPSYSEWRIGEGIVRKVREGLQIHYERYMEWEENRKR